MSLYIWPVIGIAMFVLGFVLHYIRTEREDKERKDLIERVSYLEKEIGILKMEKK